MRKSRMVSMILSIVGIMMISIALIVENENSFNDAKKIQFTEIDMASLAASANMVINKDKVIKDNVEEVTKDKLILQEVAMEVVPASVVVQPIIVKSYDEMSLDELIYAVNFYQLPMKYSEPYTYSTARLTKRRGVVYYNGHKETYYSEKVLPGGGLYIPGRHVADDGTIRDGAGYIVVAADPNFMPYGTILVTSLGPAKVYDSGCPYGVIDIYTSW